MMGDKNKPLEAPQSVLKTICHATWTKSGMILFCSLCQLGERQSQQDKEPGKLVEKVGWRLPSAALRY